MAVILEGGCRVSGMHESEPLVEGTLGVRNQIGRATGAQDISLRVFELAPGMSPSIRNHDCDEVLYVLNGEKGQLTIFIDGRSHEVDANTGIFIRPGETVAFNNSGPDSLAILSSQCPDPDRTPEFVGRFPASKSEPIVSHRLPIVRLADRAPQQTADRWYRVLVDDEVGSTQATQFVGAIPPGRAPDHFHNYEEVLFILKGAGRMWAGETNTPIAEGSCIYLPKGQVHCVENTGPGELLLLGVFYPAGSPSVRYDA